VTLIFVGAVAYIGVGVYLNNKNEGKHGVEAIPHVRYWEQLPVLVRDGLAFSYTRGRSVFERSKGVYETVRDRYGSSAA
jgi:hypothetical protein